MEWQLNTHATKDAVLEAARSLPYKGGNTLTGGVGGGQDREGPKGGTGRGRGGDWEGPGGDWEGPGGPGRDRGGDNEGPGGDWEGQGGGRKGRGGPRPAGPEGPAAFPRKISALLFPGLALTFILENSFSPESGSRAGIPKIAILLTDGKSQDDVVPPAQRLRDAGVDVFAIGRWVGGGAAPLWPKASRPQV